MATQQLYFFVEGDRDERFVRFLIEPRLADRVSKVSIVPYARMKPLKVSAFIRTLRSMEQPTAFLTDLDRNPCITKRKQKILSKYRSVHASSICVVVKEIECWYLAGIDAQSSKKLKIAVHGDCETLSKEEFRSLIPKRYSSEIDFIQEIIKVYSFELAMEKCKSLAYTMKKLEQFIGHDSNISIG